jgi:branched-chain amino acid transport system permease protein
MTDQTLSTKPSPEAVAARGILLGRARWGLAEYAFWAIAIALYFLMPNKLMLLSEIAILGLLALSIDLVLGFAGIVTLGQGAFFGVGAYAAGLAAKYGAGDAPWSDPLLGLLIGGGVAGLLGFVTSFLVLRGSDLTRLMVTLGVALIVEELVNQMKWLTGGSDGLQGVMPSAVLGIWEFDLYGKTAYLYSLTLLAIKGNPLRTRAIGLPINGRLVTVYTIGAFYAGVAGALVTQTTQFASPDYVAFHRSADALLMLVFGGAGHLYGGLIGSVIFRVMQDYLGNITPQYWQFWLGLMLVLLVLLVRGGILGLLAKMRDRVLRKGGNAS